MEERIKKLEEIRIRSLARKRNKIKAFLFLFLFFIISYGFLYTKKRILNLLWNLEIFKIKHIKIYPENKIEMLKFLEIEEEQNLLFIDIKSLIEKINSLPEIEECKIKKVFPSTIEIHIKERKPWKILKYEDKSFLIDKNGIILNNYNENSSLIVIYGIKINEKESKIEESEKLIILSELEKWYNYFNIKNYFKISRIDISNLNKIEISDGERFILLTSVKLKEKMEKLSFILKQIKKNFEYIDMRFKDAYIKIRNEGTNNYSG
ncbi:MAG: FtsQ-type POTRA domain-containing protein [bacterium]|nr:FtsQ-type POTRA domain-containing protein [bacterium]